MSEEKQAKQNAIKSYLKQMPKRYFITAFSGMAQGLFVTLIAGTILAQIAGWIGGNYFGKTLLAIANLAKVLMGAGIGVGIAHALGKNKLLIFAAAVAGIVGGDASKELEVIAHVTPEQKVKKGDLLVSFDMDAIKAAGYPLTTPMIVCNTDDYTHFQVLRSGEIQNGVDLLNIK